MSEENPESKHVRFNINSPVRVKLNDVGLKRYREYAEDLNARMKARSDTDFSFPTEPKLDAEGYYSEAMWGIMQRFGDLIVLGRKSPFDTDIIFNKGDLEDV